MINKQILLGRLGKNPEFKALDGGNSFVKFTIATSDNYKDKDGNWVENTEWHNCIAFGKLAESIEKRFERGFLAYIEGKTMHRAVKVDVDKTKYFTQVKIDKIRKVDGGTTRIQEGNKEADLLAQENGFVVKPDELHDFNSVDLPAEAKDDGLPF